MSVSVVVPVYDEADNIPLLYDAVTSVMQRMHVRYEIILVNDLHLSSEGVLRKVRPSISNT